MMPLAGYGLVVHERRNRHHGTSDKSGQQNLRYVHTGAYNSFTGSGPRGSNTQIHDAETAFHVYAIDWTADKMDFYMEERMYFTFYNDHTGFDIGVSAIDVYFGNVILTKKETQVMINPKTPR